MLHGVTVIAGPARRGKARRFAAAYRDGLAHGAPGVALWLSPSYRSASAIAETLLGGALCGCFTPNCLTFEQFARRILEASTLRIRPLGAVLQREILRHLIDEAMKRGQLRYFAPIA